MFDFVPTPVAAFLGCALMVFIGIKGFKATQYKGKDSKGDSGSSSNKKD